jgi:hypothetical protein
MVPVRFDDPVVYELDAGWRRRPLAGSDRLSFE